MKNIFRISIVILVILSIFLIHSCKKKEKLMPPSLITTAVTEISFTTAASGGDLTDIGGAYITARGVCWNTSGTPAILDSKTIEIGGLGSFTSSLTQLTPGTKYYVRAYGTNVAGTGYGNEESFTTSQVALLVLTTTTITSITQTTAVSGGKLQGTTYFVRSYGTNNAGTSYGNEISFSTTATLPTITTTAASLIAGNTATSGGNITSDGGSLVTARGVCWSTSYSPTVANSKTTDGSGTGSFESNLYGLTARTYYYLRAYATNIVGTAYGTQISFLTLAGLPTITTSAIIGITSTTAISGGNVTSDGGASPSAHGVCWSTSSNPTIANSKTSDCTGTVVFPSSITGLSVGTTYYVRAYATNSAGTAYGDELIFTTSMANATVTDIVGNTYSTVAIGTQVWMAENLKTVKLNDGSAIPLVTERAAWAALVTPGYCWYNNDSATYKATYGALYNWYTVNTGKLCPMGWHIPADTEWDTLIHYLMNNGYGFQCSGSDIAKSLAATSGWNTSSYIGYPGGDQASNNRSGFTALPAGFRFDDFTFAYLGSEAEWWSSTEYSSTQAYYALMRYELEYMFISTFPKKFGYSVRCLKDN
ncbi:MAG: hypothetical protein NT144_06030 [Bacteroidia bacterium]|nr:hypothetical protein [Bacteroidia bacterium]